MDTIYFLSLLFLSVGVHGVCYEKYSKTYINEGENITRIKPMGESTLEGIYNCTCLSGGRLWCTAFDIPCFDVITRHFVPKYEMFNVWFQPRTRRMLRRCQCLGGRARYSSCDRVSTETGSVGCPDISGSIVPTGSYYYSNKYGINLKCICDRGSPLRHSCERLTLNMDPCKYSQCDANARCYPMGVRYSCRCFRGFSGNGLSCQDIDECSSAYHPCDINASCNNSVGSYSCSCNAGYTGNGFLCRASTVDPCIAGSSFCDSNAYCVPYDNEYTCKCIDGYTGNGETCSDENECSTGKAVCDPNASCENTVGSYTCTCNGGFKGDGYNCQVKSPCVDATGSSVNSGERFLVRRGLIELRCICEDGKPLAGSCIPVSTTTTSTTTTTPTKPTASSEEKCFDSKNKRFYYEGDRYTWKRGSRSYSCVCTKGPRSMISRCYIRRT